jgi:hypothetical protein
MSRLKNLNFSETKNFDHIPEAEKMVEPKAIENHNPFSRLNHSEMITFYKSQKSKQISRPRQISIEAPTRLENRLVFFKNEMTLIREARLQTQQKLMSKITENKEDTSFATTGHRVCAL